MKFTMTIEMETTETRAEALKSRLTRWNDRFADDAPLSTEDYEKRNEGVKAFLGNVMVVKVNQVHAFAAEMEGEPPVPGFDPIAHTPPLPDKEIPPPPSVPRRGRTKSAEGSEKAMKGGEG